MNSRSSDRKIPLGIFGKPFGLKGYLYFRYYGNNPEGLSEFEKIYLSDNNLVFSEHFRIVSSLPIEPQSLPHM